MQRRLTFAFPLVAALVAAALFAGVASAGQPTTQTLNPPAPPDYSCSSNGGGTISHVDQIQPPLRVAGQRLAGQDRLAPAQEPAGPINAGEPEDDCRRQPAVQQLLRRARFL